jgi:hypothetical protein
MDKERLMKEHSDDRCREVGVVFVSMFIGNLRENVYPIPIPEAQLPAGQACRLIFSRKIAEIFRDSGTNAQCINVME